MVYQQNDAKEAERRTLGDVLEALGRSEFEEAYRLADGAIRGGALEPALFNARAIWLQQQGRFAEALTDFECARASFPRDPALLGSIGACLFHLQRFQRAVSALDLAIAARPDNTTAHYVRGLALQSMSEPEAARRAFERTLSLKPDYLEAIMSLASLMAQMGRGAEASELAKRALALDSGLPEAILILARIESEAGDDDAVEKRLWPHLDDTRFADGERMSARGLVANALDRQGRTKEAFELYEKINEERRNEGAPKFAVGRAIDNVRGLTNYFERSVAWPPSPTGATHSLAPAGHVFLLGFMRSGTTLLASILASNPQIVAVDERDFLQESSQFFLGGDDGVDRLD
ncbi:MAG: tetratricopeptide repeat protein, partial [Rhizomicrobium sp.]